MPAIPLSLWSPAPERTLLASREIETDEWVFPAVPDDSPLAHRHVTVPVEGIGVLYSYTVIHPGPRSGLDPYALAYVDFPGPVRIFGRVKGSERPVIGQRYQATPDETLGYMFAAVDA